MLKSRRCDLVPSRLDSAIGYRLLGMADYEQLGLAYRTVPGLAPRSLHFGVGARHPQGAALIELFDRGIERLQANGEMARWRTLRSDTA